MTAVDARRAAPAPSDDRPPPPPRPRHGSYGPAPIDLRMRWPLRRMLVIVAVLGAVVANIGVALFQDVRYEGQVMLLGLKMDGAHAELGVQYVDSRLQSITSLARSEPYLVELARRAGVQMDVAELREMVTATRPKLGVLITITVTGTDEELVRRLSEQAVPALDTMVDRVRAGSMVVLDDEGRNPFTGETSDYTGPLYTDMFRGAPFIRTIEPSVVKTGFAGAGLGVLLLVTWVLWAHERRVRVSTVEDVDSLLSMPQIGSLHRPSPLRRDLQRDVARGLALTVDGLAGGPRVLAVAGCGTHRERAVATLTLGAGLVAALDVPVVLVDLDVRNGALSRLCGAVTGPSWPPALRRARHGVSDAVAMHVPPDPMLRRVPRGKLPLALRDLLDRGDDRLQILPVGTHVGAEGFVDDGALVEVVDQLAPRGIVLVHLPDVPGPTMVGDVLGRTQLAILVLMDGWAELDEAMAAADVLRAGAPRTGYLLLED